MRTILCLCAVVSVALCRPGDTYDPKYDSFDATELAQNVRLLKSYGKCFLDQGPCTAEGHEFKRIIPEGLRTKCAKCTPKQRELVRTVVRAFQQKLPDMWTELSKKEDPKGELRADFEAFLNEDN